MSVNRIRVTLANEGGVALVAVLVIMFVGAIAAILIAGTVIFTIQANAHNKGATQAFIAAESGRDAAVAAIAEAISTGDGVIACDLSTGFSVAPDADPVTGYTATVRWAASTSQPEAWSSISSGADTYSNCPTENSNWVVIHATGPLGTNVAVDSAYGWSVVPHTSASGTMAGTNGSFHAVGGGASGATFHGDLVVRTDDFTCSNSLPINGNLWVLGGVDGTSGGNVTLSRGCQITGSIYAAGYVKSSSTTVSVGKSILAGRDVEMDSNGVTVGGQCTADDGPSCGGITAGGAVTLSNTGGTGTIVGPVTGASTPIIGTQWRRPGVGGAQVTGAVGPAPTFPVPLNASQNGGSSAGTVWSMTTWIELGQATSWGSPVTVNASCPANPTAILTDATGPMVFDYTGCFSGQTTSITLSSGGVPHDAVFLVQPNKTMKVKITGSLTGASEPTSQLFFVHESLNTGEVTNDCGTGGASGDSFDSGGNSIAPRVMIYTPCGMAGTWTGGLTGQLYVGKDMTYNGDFNCTPMEWLPTPSPMPHMSCNILGSIEEGGSITTTYSQSLGQLDYQTEE